MRTKRTWLILLVALFAGTWAAGQRLNLRDIRKHFYGDELEELQIDIRQLVDSGGLGKSGLGPELLKYFYSSSGESDELNCVQCSCEDCEREEDGYDEEERSTAVSTESVRRRLMKMKRMEIEEPTTELVEMETEEVTTTTDVPSTTTTEPTTTSSSTSAPTTTTSTTTTTTTTERITSTTPDPTTPTTLRSTASNTSFPHKPAAIPRTYPTKPSNASVYITPESPYAFFIELERVADPFDDTLIYPPTRRPPTTRKPQPIRWPATPIPCCRSRQQPITDEHSEVLARIYQKLHKLKLLKHSSRSARAKSGGPPPPGRKKSARSKQLEELVLLNKLSPDGGGREGDFGEVIMKIPGVQHEGRHQNGRNRKPESSNNRNRLRRQGAALRRATEDRKHARHLRKLLKEANRKFKAKSGRNARSSKKRRALV